MTSFEIYVFALCFIVFTLLTAMFSYLIWSITKMEIELIQNGHRDIQIQEEFEKKNKQGYRAALLASKVISFLLCLAFATSFVAAIYVRVNEDRPANGIPSFKVVKSASMAEKHEKNKYLFSNKLNDQFQQFDVVVCEHLPAEEDLKLYDIVVYKQKDVYVIHRIVGIEEPNESHPNHRHFLLQGDAVERPDKFPVLYSQMQGIYKGERIPFVGSFVLFLQSPAGWLCMLLVVFSMIISPIVEKMVDDEKKMRISPTAAAVFYPPEKVVIPSQKPNRVEREIKTHYNRPGSPYSEPRQRQHQEKPYRHTEHPVQTIQASIPKKQQPTNKKGS